MKQENKPTVAVVAVIIVVIAFSIVTNLWIF